MTKRRKNSRSGFDYAAAYADSSRGFHQAPVTSNPYAGPGQAYTLQPYYPGSLPYHHPVYNGYLNSGYGTWYANAYGAEGFQYMRSYDPSYDAFYTEGPSVDDKWRSTYPYVPTSYLHQQQSERSQIGSTNRSRRGTADTSGGETTETDTDEEEREHWGSKWEFIFSCVGLSVGIGNVWRFPYLAYENGGGAFLIPYVILLLIIGKPMYFMEIALGQFAQLGPLEVWKSMIPIGRGVGSAMVTISLIVAIYYNVVMGYCLYYMFASFASVLPWESCDESWGADLATCYSSLSEGRNCSDQKVCQTASEQYWERAVLAINKAPLIVDGNKTFNLPDFGSIGEIKWDLSLCLLLSWIIVFACLAKGIKTSGKVVYFTATFPYVILIILLVRGLLLDGAYEGIKYFFVPEWEKLKDITVWRKAAEQMFFSLSVSWGGLIMFGSYNKFKHKVHYPALVISSLDFVTSIIAGVVVFSILGELKQQGGYSSIQEVVQQKQGLAFVAYPEAILHLAVPQLWSVLFFFMLFTLGLDSQFALMETVLTGIYDMFPKARDYKPTVTLIACCCCYLLSIPCVSYSGQYIFDLMDTYGGGIGVLWIAIFETMAIMWFYGVNRFSEDLRFMLNHKQNILLRICWSLIPILLIVIFGISIYFWEVPTYRDNIHGNVHYPEWAHGIGWFLVLIVALQIPVVAIIVVIYYASKGRIRQAVQPTQEWGPGDKYAKQDWIAYQYNKAMRCKQHPYGYDNFAMNYSMPYFNHAETFHM